MKIDKNDIFNILEDWNFWGQIPHLGIKRQAYLEKCQAILTKSNQILVLTGSRRSGKSFILKQLIVGLIQGKQLHPHNTLLVNFEDPRWISLGPDGPDILQQIYNVYIERLSPKGPIYIFLDEVQEVENWERWVNSVHELKKARICITGSNAKLLSQDLSTLLTGRSLTVQVFPLSFQEILLFKPQHEPATVFDQYLETGGYPDVVLTEDPHLRKELLLAYYTDILEKDLIKRFKIRKQEKLKQLTRYYLSHIGSHITYRSLEKYLELTPDTLEHYSGHLESSYLIKFLSRFSYKLKEIEKSSRKIYAIDHALATAIGYRAMDGSSQVLENIVFVELLRSKLNNPSLEVYYYWTEQKHEVDFLVKENETVRDFIQVCWNPTHPETMKREIRSLLQSLKRFQLKTGIVLTYGYESELKEGDILLRFIPVWKWCLKSS